MDILPNQISMFDTESGVKTPLVLNRKVRLIELFAGIGAQSAALERLGIDFEPWVVCEVDKYAVASYNAIHGTNCQVKDICSLTGKDLNIVDIDKYIYLLTYSFPCQDISNAGLSRGFTKGTSTRSGLLWQVERLLHETANLPDILLMENVPAIHNKKHLGNFESWIKSLEDIGYTSVWSDLNAKNYGVPQNRNRTFMISWLGNHSYNFPKGFDLDKRLKDVLEENVEEKYYLPDERVQSMISDMDDFSLEQ